MSDPIPEPPGAEARPENDLKATAKETTSAVAAEIRDAAAGGAARVREGAAARTEDAKQGLAREMSATARALDAASRDMADHPLQHGLLREASSCLASLADALHSRPAGDLVAHVADFGRRNPVAFLGGATLAGFALARLAMASAPADPGAAVERGAKS